jgi:hypothetical protein
LPNALLSWLRLAGRNADEALANLKEAIEGILEVRRTCQIRSRHQKFVSLKSPHNAASSRHFRPGSRRHFSETRLHRPPPDRQSHDLLSWQFVITNELAVILSREISPFLALSTQLHKSAIKV